MDTTTIDGLNVWYVEVMICLEHSHQSSPSKVGFHSRSEIHLHTLSGNRLSFDCDNSQKNLVLNEGNGTSVFYFYNKSLSS